MKQAIEVVVFRAKPDTKPEQLQSAALAVTPVLSAMPGFISREFGESEDGQFIDIVYWKDLTSAKQAAENRAASEGRIRCRTPAAMSASAWIS